MNIMSRYRPPQPRSSAYITAPGYRCLQRELQALWQRRKEVTRALAEAAAEGDRSENAEYIYRKKELRGIDRRIRYLQVRLPELTVVEHIPADPGRVFFGARVTLQADDGMLLTYRIVGPDEFDVEKGDISMDAPLAQGLLKRERGTEVSIMTPEGEKKYLIADIHYEAQ